MKTLKCLLFLFGLVFINVQSSAFADAFDINEFVLRKSGCCSSHKGVSNKCTATGRVVCNDRVVSPTCRCQPPRPRPKPSNPSSGNSGSRNYSGTYSGRLELTANHCGFDVSKILNTSAVVRDSGRSISVTLPTGKAYPAQPQARQGFEFYINESLGTYDGVSCNQKDWLWWFDVNQSGAKFQYYSTINCSSGASCSIVWYGNLSRK